MWRASVIWLVACRSAPPPPPIVLSPREPEITASEGAIGPVTAATRATVLALRKAFVGYSVQPANVFGGDEEVTQTLEYQVYQGREKLMVVVPREDGSILNVRVTSSKVAVADRPWRVGKPMPDATRIDHCECPGEHPICYKRGEHVAVGFDLKCDQTRRRTRVVRVLQGAPITSLIWSPQPFGSRNRNIDDDLIDLGDYPDPCGP